MATKSKSRARAGLLAALWLLALAALLVSGMLAAYAYIVQNGYTYYTYPSFIDQLQLCGMARYWQARCAWDGVEYEPSAVLLDDGNALLYAMALARGSAGEDSVGVDSSSAAPAFSGQREPERHGGLDVYSEDAVAAIDSFNENVFALVRSFSANWPDLQYTLVDTESGAVYAPETDLSGFLHGGLARDAWDYIVAVRLDESGAVEAARDWVDAPDGAAAEQWTVYGGDWEAMTHSYLLQDAFQYYDFAPPHDVTMIFAVPKELSPSDELAGYGSANRTHRYYGAFRLFFWPALAACALLALWFGRKRGSGLGGKRLAALPLEAHLAVLLGAGALGGALLSECLASLCDGSISYELENNFSVDLPAAANAFAFLLALFLSCAVLALVFLPLLAMRQGVVRYGWKGYLTRHTLVGQALRLLRTAWRSVGRQIVRLWNALTRVDLRDSADRTLIRLLAVNFVIVTFICCFWVFGVLGTLLYSVVLFFLLRGRLEKEQKNYAALLDGARRMAGGDLATPLAGDLGMFDPLRDELNAVRDGFEKAVAAEVRSQNMKTELITNVSHDLKTPLTAIITYVDLLKDPNLSDDERARYVDTLDKKSQRLKRLIEDLFEVSKAASGNAVMRYSTVDLTALVKQVQYELADQMQASGLDFRWQLPETRLPLVLDGQKTCRILENLIVNIVKYGMPGTRAYITLTPTAHGAQLVCKNVSATELDFDASEITERFVRGDRARNTEGSGLGLAIVKSFAELQGGSFTVTTDGDLFKAAVTLPDTNPLPEDGADGAGA